jgi:hypothetical protein
MLAQPKVTRRRAGDEDKAAEAADAPADTAAGAGAAAAAGKDRAEGAE